MSVIIKYGGAMRNKLFISLFSIMLIYDFAFTAEKYAVDPGHAHMGLAVKHFGVAHMICSFKEISGTIMYDEKDITKSSVEILIKTASLISGDAQRENAVKGPAFLHVEKFTEITFRSKQINKEDDKLQITGDLMIHGVTKEISFPFKLNGPVVDPWGNPRIGIEASLTVNRQDFGIAFNRTLKSGELLVGNEVRITFSFEATPAADTSSN